MFSSRNVSPHGGLSLRAGCLLAQFLRGWRGQPTGWCLQQATPARPLLPSAKHPGLHSESTDLF